MKTLTISALIATLLAVPFLLRRRALVSIPVNTGGPAAAANLRYDTSDLLT